MKLNKLTLTENTNFEEIICLLDKNGCGFLAIVDSSEKLIGIVTDGDIRRAILNKVNNINQIINKNPITMSPDVPYKLVINKLKELKRRHMPIVDSKNILIDVITLDELDYNIKSNCAVIMAGGLGTRLRPLTDNIPKPMLKVGNKPILETIIKQLSEHGIINILISVNYKSEIIKNHFGDGSSFGVNIEYIDETKRMGTAGSLTLMKEKLLEPFFVMNGDILTNINFSNLYEFSSSNNNDVTMCVREYSFEVPYGVVNVDNSKVLSIEEKPSYDFYVSAGIYLLSPKVLKEIPEDKFYDMPTLFEDLISKNYNVQSFPIKEYWLDIGKMNDFMKANDEYDKFFQSKG